MMNMYHDSRNPAYRAPMGAGMRGSGVRLCLKAECAKAAYLRLWWDNAPIVYPMRRINDTFFEASITLPEHSGVLWYYFIAEDAQGNRTYYGNADDQLGGVGKMYAHEPPSYQITVYDAAYDTPHWMREGVMLQIMTDRYARTEMPNPQKYAPDAVFHENWDEAPFLELDEYGDNRANDFYGGSLRGIMEKLEYIAGLGITILYLNPIFQSPSNHKYNTSDYRKIDPAFGTEEDFHALCEKAKGYGIRVILDGVFSHTGADSVYFNRYGNFPEIGAYQSKESPYYAWYRFQNWRDEYDAWWGFPTLPNVDEEQESYRNFMLGEEGVAAHWLKKGASGWRLDVADELPMRFLRTLRERVKATDPNAAVLGEVWEDPSRKVTYGELRCYCAGDTLDSTMNYPLRDAILAFFLGQIDAEGFKRRWDSMAENLPKQFLYSEMNLLGSHDKPRIINILADCGNMEPDRKYRYDRKLTDAEYALGSRRFLAAWQWICALPGMPCLYYGDEAGMTGMADPFCRGSYPWGHEDTALQSAAREAILRRGKRVLQVGDAEIFAPHEDVLLIARTLDGTRAIFAVNRSDCARKFAHCGREYAIEGISGKWLEEA